MTLQNCILRGVLGSNRLTMCYGDPSILGITNTTFAKVTRWLNTLVNKTSINGSKYSILIG